MSKRFKDFTLTETPGENDYIVGYAAITGDEIRIPFREVSKKGDKGDSVFVQYSISGSSWHAAYQEGDRYYRQKAGDGSWTPALILEGKDGAPGGPIYIEYSSTGAFWHATYRDGDEYYRQKVGDGSWTPALRLEGKNAGPYVVVTMNEEPENLFSTIECPAQATLYRVSLQVSDDIRDIRVGNIEVEGLTHRALIINNAGTDISIVLHSSSTRYIYAITDTYTIPAFGVCMAEWIAVGGWLIFSMSETLFPQNIP